MLKLVVLRLNRRYVMSLSAQRGKESEYCVFPYRIQILKCKKMSHALVLGNGGTFGKIRKTSNV